MELAIKVSFDNEIYDALASSAVISSILNHQYICLLNLAQCVKIARDRSNNYC